MRCAPEPVRSSSGGLARRQALAAQDFANHQLVAFLEGIGAAFGACQNAMTSADETIYELLIPTDKPGSLQQCFSILASWCCKIRQASPPCQARRLPTLRSAPAGDLVPCSRVCSPASLIGRLPGLPRPNQPARVSCLPGQAAVADLLRLQVRSGRPEQGAGCCHGGVEGQQRLGRVGSAGTPCSHGQGCAQAVSRHALQAHPRGHLQVSAGRLQGARPVLTATTPGACSCAEQAGRTASDHPARAAGSWPASADWPARTQYAERLPIGLEEVIAHCDAATVKGFYQRW